MKTTNEVVIDKITIKIGDTKVPVTMDQAKKLHAALSEMFGRKETVKHEHHYDYSRPWHWPWDRPVVTWSTTGNDANFYKYKDSVDQVRRDSITSGSNLLLSIE